MQRFILRWCETNAPGDLQGADLRALIEGGDAAVHGGVALEYHSSNWGEVAAPLRGWRTEQWKYVEGPAGPEELYDLARDPHERTNLVADPSAAGEREALRTALYEWMAGTGDHWPQVPIPDRIVPKRPGVVPEAR